MNKGQFQPGSKGGPGRPRGARSKLGELFYKVLYEDFKEHGVAVIQQVREEQPGLYLKIVAMVVPQQIDLTASDDLVIRSAPIEAVNDLMMDAIATHRAEESARPVQMLLPLRKETP